MNDVYKVYGEHKGDLVPLYAYQVNWSNPVSYDEKYLSKIRKKEKDNPISDKLNQYRVELVSKINPASLLDFGCGSRMFIRKYQKSKPHVRIYGYDLIPEIKKELVKFKQWLDPFSFHLAGNYLPLEVITFFDSLEHLINPSMVLLRIPPKGYVIVSIPIFDSLDDHYLSNHKHYRPNEHYWYFTHQGILSFFKTLGFQIVLCSNQESRIGRKDIFTYIFKRNEN